LSVGSIVGLLQIAAAGRRHADHVRVGAGRSAMVLRWTLPRKRCLPRRLEPSASLRLQTRRDADPLETAAKDGCEGGLLLQPEGHLHLRPPPT
jgi:hypothetical protein